MTLPRIRAIHKYWVRHPPIAWIEAAKLGISKKTPAPTPTTNDNKNLGGLLAAFGMPPGQKSKVIM